MLVAPPPNMHDLRIPRLMNFGANKRYTELQIINNNKELRQIIHNNLLIE